MSPSSAKPAIKACLKFLQLQFSCSMLALGFLNVLLLLIPWPKPSWSPPRPSIKSSLGFRQALRLWNRQPKVCPRLTLQGFLPSPRKVELHSFLACSTCLLLSKSWPNCSAAQYFLNSSNMIFHLVVRFSKLVLREFEVVTPKQGSTYSFICLNSFFV